MSLDKLLEGQLSYMSKYYDVVAVSSDESRLQKVGDKEGVKTYCVEMSRKITPFEDLKSLWKLYKFLRKEKPLIVHTHTPKAGTVGMMASCLAGIPYRIHTVAGLPLIVARGSKRKLLNFVEKITYKCATSVWPNSYALKDIIIKEKLCSPEKLKVIANGSSNGINTKYFDPVVYTTEYKEQLKRKLGINQEDFVFVFVGRLVSDKGINELVEVFDRLRINYMDIKLLLVGPEEKELDPLSERTLSAIDNNKGIISVGYQSDVRPYFAISDALVFPSYREGFPNVVMQAGAMGLPAIVTDINGCNEIIINHKNGTIIPVKDAGTLYQMMERYVADKEYVSGLKENAREMIASRYEQSMIWNALLEEYKSLEKACANNV